MLELYTFLFAICNLLQPLCVVLSEIHPLMKKNNNLPLQSVSHRRAPSQPLGVEDAAQVLCPFIWIIALNLLLNQMASSKKRLQVSPPLREGQSLKLKSVLVSPLVSPI